MPAPPEAPDDPGVLLAAFEGHVGKFQFNQRTGALQLVVDVAAEHKYAAMGLTDIRGRRFNIQVFNPPDAKPVSTNSAVDEAKARVAQRKRDREWAKVRKEQFGQ